MALSPIESRQAGRQLIYFSIQTDRQTDRQTDTAQAGNNNKNTGADQKEAVITLTVLSVLARDNEMKNRITSMT